MRAVVQRCLYGKVRVEGEIVDEIDKGIVALIGFSPTDNEKTIDYMLEKIITLRIFEDDAGKMNLSLLDTKGELLVVPNFTIYGDARRGRRPGYSDATTPKDAEEMFNILVKKAKDLDLPKVGSGIFQTDMKIELVNDGPITLLLDSEKLF